jgi:predicted RNase H-like nuclease (RuvC/YqgF family)
MKTDTDTPESGSVWPEILRLREIIKSLEMQLAASQQELERLKKELAAWDYGTRAKREQERAEKAEAEVERLKLLLSDLLILTEKNYWNSHNYNQIKEAINQTDK